MIRIVLPLGLLLFICSSCNTPKVLIEYQGTSPIPYINSNEELSKVSSKSSPNQHKTVIVTSLPILKGGNRALKRLIEYPEEAIQNKVEGEVSIQFMIDEKGKAFNFIVAEGIGYGCDEAVISGIEQSRFETENKHRYLWLVTAEFKL